MFVGLLAAVAHGAVLPASMLVFGNMINFFVFHNVSAIISANLTNSAPNTMPVNCTAVNDVIELFRNTSIVASGQSASIGSQAFSCLTAEGLYHEINLLVAAFVGLALGSMLLGFIQVSTFSLAAMMQTHRIRKRFYRSILRQNVAWFDENKAGELNSRLVE